ncbi:MAG TPA: AI-2E family transporter, partial [Lacipirellulaceae bacterium]|nr:AI-2E family transporter [Lacipirellulaceae bacterium]
DAPIFLLTMLTMVLAIVPFAGAAAVWVPTAIWIYLYQVREVDGVVVTGDSFSAIALAIYGLTIVSTIDNVIKPLVLHGQSNLHPLVALISILGGVQTLGPIGILVGPMLVAFAQALLNMVNKELARMGDEQPSAPIPTLTSHLIPDAASAAGDATDAPGSSPSVESTQVAGAPSPPPSAGRRGKGRRRK